MSDKRPPSGNFPADDTRDRVIALEVQFQNLSRRFDEKTSELKTSVDQIGADLGGLATKEELRQVVDSLAELGRKFDAFTVECRKNGGGCSALERKQPDVPKKPGDISLRDFTWDAFQTVAKLIAVGVITAVILAGLYSHVQRAGVPSGLPTSGAPTMAPSSSKPPSTP